jgi:hypothetical protein
MSFAYGKQMNSIQNDAVLLKLLYPDLTNNSIFIAAPHTLARSMLVTPLVA